MVRLAGGGGILCRARTTKLLPFKCCVCGAVQSNAEAVTQTLPHWGSLQRSPKPSWIWAGEEEGKGRKREVEGREREGRESGEREREGPQVTIEPGTLRDLLCHCLGAHVGRRGAGYIVSPRAQLVIISLWRAITV